MLQSTGPLKESFLGFFCTFFPSFRLKWPTFCLASRLPLARDKTMMWLLHTARGHLLTEPIWGVWKKVRLILGAKWSRACDGWGGGAYEGSREDESADFCLEEGALFRQSQPLALTHCSACFFLFFFYTRWQLTNLCLPTHHPNTFFFSSLFNVLAHSSLSSSSSWLSFIASFL